METNATVETILKDKGRTVWSVTPNQTVFETLALMAERNVGALVVIEGERLVGIVSERDYARKVALFGKNSRTTLVREILTPTVHTVGPDSSISECLELMTDKRTRHLPVLDGGRVVGIVSIGDLVNLIIRTQRAAIDQLQAYIAGGYPV
jgi:CBS domain-containing protein